MAVVTLGGLTGGGGRLLGPAVAERLSSDYVDRLILANVARHVGATVEALHEREARPPSRGVRFTGLLQRILERSAMADAAGDPYFGPGALALLTQDFEEMPQPTITRGHEVGDESYFEAIRKVITRLGEAGNVVIVGRGSSEILRDRPDVLRVGTVSLFEDRVQHIMELEGLEPSQAERTVAERDQARSYYFKRYFGIDNPDDPSRYHLTINLSAVSLEYATELVVGASRALEKGTLAT